MVDLDQSEVGWALSNADSVVVSGGAPASLALCLDAGCYTFSMTDAWGDGWNGATYSIRLDNDAGNMFLLQEV